MQKSVRYNEGHALFLSAVARKEGTKRGYLSKKTAENSRWHEKFFALYQNILFYFENEQSARPAGIYLLEGCTCERVPAPKMSTTGKEALEKQVRFKESTAWKYTKASCQLPTASTTCPLSALGSLTSVQGRNLFGNMTINTSKKAQVLDSVVFS